MNQYFLHFLSSLEPSNKQLIDTIRSGYELIESISTDDANNKPNGQTVSHVSPASVVNYKQNPEEYFPKTLNPELLNVAIKSQTGYRQAQYPTSGRTSLGRDPLKSNETSNYSASYGEGQV